MPACFLFSDEPLLPPELADPCSIVHETYPNVGEDSCLWVLNVMRNFPPPEFLPAATDTGGPLLAARVLTDTGELLFVAGPVPERLLGVPCTWWKSIVRSDKPHLYVSGTYCARPPVDAFRQSLSFALSDSMTLYQEPDRWRLMFQVGDFTMGTQNYHLLRDENFRVTDAAHDSVSRIAHGRFEAILHNERDPTDSIRLVDGRFDMRY